MPSAYLDDIMNDPILRRIFSMQQAQAPAGLPAEPGVTATHPALPDEPQAATIQEGPGPGLTPDQARKATLIASTDPALRGTDVGGGYGTPAPPPVAMGPPEFTGTMPQQGPAIDRSAPAEPPVPIPEQRRDVDPRVLAMMQPPPPPGPQAAGMPKIVDAPDGNVLLTGDSAANRPAANAAPAAKKPGFLSKLKLALPDMITAAVAAGATPSHYGGGPLDIFQGVQAGQAAVQAKHDQAYNRDRQQRLDDLNTAHVRAEIQQAQAAAHHYDASADALKAQATAKDKSTAAEQEYAQMNKYPSGSKEWKFHHDLWQEALHGKSANADKVWYEVKGTPGMERNSVTGEWREVVPGAGIPKRIDEIRRSRKDYNPNLPLTDNQIRQTASPEEMFYLRNGKWPTTPADKNPTLASLAADAFDPTKSPEERAAAKQAVAAMHPGPAPPDPMIAEARQARMDQARAEEFTKIENKKKADLDYAQKYQDTALKNLATERKLDTAEVAKLPEGQAILKNARRLIQDAHNAYTASIRRSTKDQNAAEDWVVLPSGEAVPKRIVDSMGMKQGPDGEWMPPKASSYDEDIKKRRAARDYTPPRKADQR